jgi:hypothetical protein
MITKIPVIDGMNPYEYAAQWGCDPAYDRLPRHQGDGYLFYNFGSESQVKDRAWLTKFAAAIRRTIRGLDPADTDDQIDCQNLLDLVQYVEQLAEDVE